MLAEMFAVDRTVMKAPIKLWEKGSEKHYYSKDFNNILYTHSQFDYQITVLTMNTDRSSDPRLSKALFGPVNFFSFYLDIYIK